MVKHVLLTGVSGFIAKRIALDLLNAGHTVRGSLRSLDRADEVRDAVRPYLSTPGSMEQLSFVELDLNYGRGWREAMQGIDVMMHTASPFPLSQPKNENELIRPAIDGTVRALRAAEAAGVNRVILTSSVVAIEANDKPLPHTEEHWTDLDHPKATAYYKSKTLAERAAWEFANAHRNMKLTTINPALVLGRPLDTHYGTSISVIERIMSGKDPMLPDVTFGVVDVTDISAMHLAAMERPEAAGQRFIGSSGTMSMPQIAQHLAGLYPDRKIATRVAPKALLRVLAFFDRSLNTVLPSIGVPLEFDNSCAQDILGISFTDPNLAVERAAEAVAAQG